MRSKEYYKSLILSHAEEIKESIYIIFSPIFFRLIYHIRGGHTKLLPLQGARRADMNTQGECPGLGASAPSGREGNGRDAGGELQGWVRGMALTFKKALFAYIYQI